MLKDYDHRLAPARIQAFRAGTEPNVPRGTARKLIAAGAAESIGGDDATPAAED